MELMRAEKANKFIELKSKRNAKEYEEWFLRYVPRNNPNIKPSEVQSVFVLSAFQEQKDWADVKREAASAIDKKWISNVKKRLRVT